MTYRDKHPTLYPTIRFGKRTLSGRIKSLVRKLTIWKHGKFRSRYTYCHRCGIQNPHFMPIHLVHYEDFKTGVLNWMDLNACQHAVYGLEPGRYCLKKLDFDSWTLSPGDEGRLETVRKRWRDIYDKDQEAWRAEVKKDLERSRTISEGPG